MLIKLLYKLILFYSLFILISCKNNETSTVDSNKIKTYEIEYFEMHFARLVLFDNNDTIYFSDNYFADIKSYRKTKASVKTLSLIKKMINDEIQYKTLLIRRDISNGRLLLKISCKDFEKKSLRKKVNSNIEVSKNFTDILNLLKEQHKDIYDTFINGKIQ